MCWSLQTTAAQKIQKWRPPCGAHSLLSTLLPSIVLVLGDGGLPDFSGLQLLCQLDAHHKVCHDPTKGLQPMQKLLDIGSRDERELGQPVAGSLSCPRIFSYGVIRVSLLTLYRVRNHAASRIVHGSIGVCVVTSKDGILSWRTARCARARPRTLETAFSTAPLLRWLCVSDPYHRICHSCPSGRHSFATLSSSN